MNDHILLAIGPVAVIVPLVILGGIGALFAKLLRRKGTAPPEPGEVASAPFLDMAAGTTTAHLERNGANWAWSLAGAVTTAGSDANAGKAALAMSEALVTAEESAPITGSIGGPDVATHTFGVQPDGADGWDWTVTTPSKLPAIGAKPAPPIMVSSGTEDSHGVALVRALASLSKVIPWLDVKDPGGAPVGTSAPVVKPGIVISGNTVAITDLATWVAYAAPKMRAFLDDGSTADEIMDAVITDLPENTLLNGKSIADVRKRVTELLNLVRADDYVVVVAPDQELAAFLVGAQLRPAGWRAMQYEGYVILVRPVQVGSANMGDAEWLVWEGGSRGYDDTAIHQGVMARGKTLSQAERYAKQQIDQANNNDGVWPGGGEAGGNQSADAAGPIHQATAGELAPVSSEAYQPAVKHIAIGPTMWTKPNQTDVEIFDFAKKPFYSFKHWRIVVGVCFRPTDSKYPFGVVSTWLEAGLVAALGNAKLVNSDVQDNAIGPPPAVWWDNFNKPLLWKGQFDGMVHAGPTIGIEPFADVTGKGVGEQVDPCEDDAANWPTPSNRDAGFYVQPVGSTQFLPWHPAPEVTLIHKGTKVLARLRYRGFPVFVANKGGTAQAQAGATTKFTADVKIWAAGTNEDQ